MQTGKSVGPFSIPLTLLKMLKSAIVPSLAVLINESFCTGIFPDKLKIAKVIAIHKKGLDVLIVLLYCSLKTQ